MRPLNFNPVSFGTRSNKAASGPQLFNPAGLEGPVPRKIDAVPNQAANVDLLKLFLKRKMQPEHLDQVANNPNHPDREAALLARAKQKERKAGQDSLRLQDAWFDLNQAARLSKRGLLARVRFCLRHPGFYPLFEPSSWTAKLPFAEKRPMLSDRGQEITALLSVLEKYKDADIPRWLKYKYHLRDEDISPESVIAYQKKIPKLEALYTQNWPDKDKELAPHADNARKKIG